MASIYRTIGAYRGPASVSVFVKVAWADYSAYVEEYSYRVYVTDCLQMSPEGKIPSRRWADVVAEPKEIDAERIMDDVIRKGGLEVIRNEPA